MLIIALFKELLPFIKCKNFAKKSKCQHGLYNTGQLEVSELVNF